MTAGTDPGIAEVLVGPDGLARCPWAVGRTATTAGSRDAQRDYLAYHDDEWGVPLRGESALYERITLEAFQSGLSWLTILRKREAFRAAFAGFDPEAVAGFDETDVARLMADAGIVRNRLKIAAAVTNARAVLGLRAGVGLEALVWSFAPHDHVPPRRLAEIPSTTTASVALARSLKSAGFVFVGPTTMYAAMQACGLVDDHLAGCFRSAG